MWRLWDDPGLHFAFLGIVGHREPDLLEQLGLVVRVGSRYGLDEFAGPFQEPGDLLS
jgi:hypothetical protein